MMGSQTMHVPGTASGYGAPLTPAWTITGPNSLTVDVDKDVWLLICNDFVVNGVPVPRVTKVMHRLMDDPAYGLSARDAGLMIGYAVQNACPQ